MRDPNPPHDGGQDQAGQARLEMVPVTHLDAHPDNPRLQLREDVVDKIAAEISRHGYQTEYAPIVRPMGDRCQIVEGHHRVEAAKRAGVGFVPCWVRPMGDDEAFMRLVLGNSQGELSPLEIGMHALKAVPLSEGGRGRKGGLSEYAERIGYRVERLSKVRDAAGVAESLALSQGFGADHLYEVSRAPRELWPVLTERLAQRGWTVADTKRHVTSTVETVEAVPEEWRDVWPLEDVAHRHLTDELSPRSMTKIIATATDAADWVDRGTIAERRWDARAILQAKHEAEATAYEVEGWHHGDWRDHIDELEDGTVALILTDPPYGVGYQSNRKQAGQAHRHGKIVADEEDPSTAIEAVAALTDKLKPDAHILIFCAAKTEAVVAAAVEALDLRIASRLIWDRQLHGMGDIKTAFAPQHDRIIHAVKGNPVLYKRRGDVLSHRRPDASRHPTEKPVELLADLIESTTAPGELVADPFGGVASTAVAAKETGRRWWSCEIDDGYHRVGEGRLS